MPVSQVGFIKCWCWLRQVRRVIWAPFHLGKYCLLFFFPPSLSQQRRLRRENQDHRGAKTWFSLPPCFCWLLLNYNLPVHRLGKKNASHYFSRGRNFNISRTVCIKGTRCCHFAAPLGNISSLKLKPSQDKRHLLSDTFIYAVKKKPKNKRQREREGLMHLGSELAVAYLWLHLEFGWHLL